MFSFPFVIDATENLPVGEVEEGVGRAVKEKPSLIMFVEKRFSIVAVAKLSFSCQCQVFTNPDSKSVGVPNLKVAVAIEFGKKGKRKKKQ